MWIQTCVYKGLSQYYECLKRIPTIEPRALNLFVKEDRRDEFEKEFTCEFGGKFLLLPKEKVLEMKLFGYGTEHKTFAICWEIILLLQQMICLFLTQKKRKRNSLALMEDLQKTRWLFRWLLWKRNRKVPKWMYSALKERKQRMMPKNLFYNILKIQACIWYYILVSNCWMQERKGKCLWRHYMRWLWLKTE